MLLLEKTFAITILGLLFLCNVDAITIYCYTPSVPPNTSGYQGVVVSGCTGWYGYKNTPVTFSHYECGNAQLNVALYVDKTYISYVTVGPGQTRNITANITGSFEVRVSLQSGSTTSCKLQVQYIY